MKHFAHFTQSNAYGSDAPGEPFSLLASSIISYAAHKVGGHEARKVGEADNAIHGTMILFSGSHGEMNSSFVAEPYEVVRGLISAALELDEKARYVVGMNVASDLIDVLGTMAEKWAPVIKAKLNER